MGRWFAKICRVDTRACPLSMWISMVISSRDSHAGSGSFLSPVEGDGAERVAREFGERVMCDAFAAVEKKRNFVAAENARERLVIAVKLADEHRAVAEAVAGADKFQDFARGKHSLGFGIRTGDEADGG